jgi:hypothetical protein
MRNIVLIAALILTMLLIILNTKAYSYDDGDFQVWNTDVEEFKINDKWKASFEEEFRWGDNGNQFFYHHYDLGFLYSLRKYLSVGAGYRQVYEIKSGSFKPEEEPYLCSSLFWNLVGLNFEDRHRLEYRHFNYQLDSWRYRNKLTVKAPWKFTKLEIQPFLSDEILVGFGSANQLSQNRFYSGLGMNLTKNLKAELYYLLVSTRNGGIWTDANVLGTKLKIAF